MKDRGHWRWRGNSIEVRVHVGHGRYKTETVRWRGTTVKTERAARRRMRELVTAVADGSELDERCAECGQLRR